MKAAALILTIILLSLAVGVLIGSGDPAPPPATATDAVLQSRTTPPVDRSTPDRTLAAWFGAGLLALALVVLAAAIFAMRGGSELLRQWRLTRKRRQRRPYPPADIPAISRPPNAPYLLPERDE